MQGSLHSGCFIYNRYYCIRLIISRHCNGKFCLINNCLGPVSISYNIKNNNNHITGASNGFSYIFGRSVINYNYSWRSIVRWNNSSDLVRNIILKILRHSIFKKCYSYHNTIYKHTSWTILNLIYY